MAYSPSPTSPTMPSGSALHSMRRSPSPPAQPLSKRDKRRTALQERLQDMTTAFGVHRDEQFQQQRQALQVDMNLVMQADPYSADFMEDSGEDIARTIETFAQRHQYPPEVSNIAGYWYSKFVLEVNEAKEEKQRELTMLMNRHEYSLANLKREYDFKLQLAAEECDILAQTLRERLYQSLNSRKNRLLKEKDTMDISDTNTLLLHPNHFSLTNPASPGGIQSNRKTRHTRHRVDVDELGNGLLSETMNKRKRKAPLDEDPGSPGRDHGIMTPQERSRARNMSRQTAPLYSIHSLFTDKELALHSNEAHVAAAHFLATSKERANGGSGAATNGKNTDDESEGSSTPVGDDGEALAAPEMDRTASQTFHATRSTRTTGLVGLSTLGDLAEKAASRPHLPYFSLTHTTIKPNGGAAPSAPPLMPEEIEDDLIRLSQTSQRPAGWVDKPLLDELSKPLTEQKSRTRVAPDFPANMEVHLVQNSVRSSVSDTTKRQRVI